VKELADEAVTRAECIDKIEMGDGTFFGHEIFGSLRMLRGEDVCDSGLTRIQQ
jgi:hypothetical protein